MKRYFLILFAEVIFSGVVVLFLIPNDVICGGISGLAMVTSRPLGLSSQTMIYILYVICLLLIIVFLDKDFFFGTLFGALLYMALVWMITRLFSGVSIPLVLLPFMGFLNGIINWLCIANKATSMGFDILGLIMRKRIPGWSIPLTTWICNAVVAVVGLAAYGVRSVIYGIIFTACQALALHIFLKRFKLD